MDPARSEPAGVDRFLAADERGRLLRVTWRPRHGFVNVSLWQGSVCVETFHLSPGDAGRLVGFLGSVLGSAVTERSQSALRLVRPDEGAPPAERRSRLGLRLAAARARLRRRPDQRDGSTGDDRS